MSAQLKLRIILTIVSITMVLLAGVILTPLTIFCFLVSPFVFWKEIKQYIKAKYVEFVA